MDAGRNLAFVGRLVVVWLSLQLAIAAASVSAADYRTQNFIVMAPDAALARAVGDAAERYRESLAVHWLGRALPSWPTPCPVRVIAGSMPAQGMTQYNREPVRDFQMEVVGSPERILDSVLPHEVTHTILATHFGRPLPRWADEGICTTVEHDSERQIHESKLREFLRSRRGIAMNQLFLLTEYPNDILPMYAQGYSVCQFLIAQRGPQQFVQFLGDYMQQPSWTDNVRNHYGYESLAELQDRWLAWVSVGNGPIEQFVKNPTRSAPVNAEVTLVAAGNSPQAAMPDGVAFATGSTRPSHPVQLASTQAAGGNLNSSADGWYVRLRRDVESREFASNPLDSRVHSEVPQQPKPTLLPRSGRASDPPSIYSSAQPMPEQGLGVGAVSAVGGAVDTSPRQLAPTSIWR